MGVFNFTLARRWLHHLLLSNPSIVGNVVCLVCAQVEFLHETCHESKGVSSQVALLHSTLLLPSPQFPTLAHNSLSLLLACLLTFCCPQTLLSTTAYTIAPATGGGQKFTRVALDAPWTVHRHNNVAVTCDLSRESSAPYRSGSQLPNLVPIPRRAIAPTWDSRALSACRFHGWLTPGRRSW